MNCGEDESQYVSPITQKIEDAIAASIFYTKRLLIPPISNLPRSPAEPRHVLSIRHPQRIPHKPTHHEYFTMYVISHQTIFHKPTHAAIPLRESSTDLSSNFPRVLHQVHQAPSQNPPQTHAYNASLVLRQDVIPTDLSTESRKCARSLMSFSKSTTLSPEKPPQLPHRLFNHRPLLSPAPSTYFPTTSNDSSTNSSPNSFTSTVPSPSCRDHPKMLAHLTPNRIFFHR